MKISLLLFLLLSPAALGRAKETTKLWAPTYYIAATAELRGPDEIRLRGSSNLPEGSRLDVRVDDVSTVLNEDLTIVLDKSGLFDVVIRNQKSHAFKHDVACAIMFWTGKHSQSDSVLQVVGRGGKNLGFPKNPQVYLASGEYYMSALIHVP